MFGIKQIDVQMAIVYGKIESLKKIRKTLDNRGIRRFRSIRDIDKFKSEYEVEKQRLNSEVEQGLEDEINACEKVRDLLLLNIETIIDTQSKKYDKRVSLINVRITRLEEIVEKYIIEEVFNVIQIYFLKLAKMLIRLWFTLFSGLKTKNLEKQIASSNQAIVNLKRNREKIISDRRASRLTELNNIKNTVEELYPRIAGAIGESLVEKELSKLSDEHFLINDFSIRFEKPIYNRKADDKIYSIQVDHLLINNAGVFIIETKNWSKNSIERYDLRSPVKQIRRAGFALFTLLNHSKMHPKLNLRRHHWGERELPVRKVIAMIHSKPREKFKFVQVKSLSELNSYVACFEPLFDKNEVKEIAAYLNSLNQSLE